MKLTELTDEELRELAELEMQYDITIVNPHLGLTRLSTQDIVARVKAKQAKAQKVAEKAKSALPRQAA